MSAKAPKQPRRETVAVVTDASPWVASLLTQFAFVLTLALVIARATMSETLREAFDAVAGGDAAPSGVGAASSLFLDAACCLPALLVLLRRAIDPTYGLTRAWSNALFAAFALWAALSNAWATDKFAAAVTAAHLIAAAAIIWSTAQLVRSWLRLRIVAGVCLGLVLVYTMHGLIYRLVDVPQNAQFWKENRQRIFEERGWPADSFQAKQFEKKFVGGEMIGFNTSPNSFAAVLVVLLIISAGVAIQRRADGDEIAWVIAVAIIMIPALWVLDHTNSRTATGTLTLAAIVLALLAPSRAREFLSRYSRRAYYASLIAIVLLTAAVVAHGIYHGTLFHDSLNFRWRYWSASAQLIRQHPLLGVGWSNFGDHYLAVRLPQAAEEVRDPHNFIVRAFAELGLVGGVLLLLWIARTAYELTRPIHPATIKSPSSPRTALIVATSAIVLGGMLAMGIGTDWSQMLAYIQLEVARRVLAIGLLFGGALLALARSRQQDSDDPAAPWLLYAILAALGAFFVHAMMDFVLAEPGPLTLFAVLIGSALGVRTPVPPAKPQHRGAVIGVLAAAAIAWVIAVAAFVIPVAEAESRAHAADDAIRSRRPDIAAGLLRTAFDSIGINADYAYRSATALIGASAPPEQVKAMLASAIERNPRNIAYYLTRAMLELREPAPDIAAVQRDFDEVLRLDPQNVVVRLDYADALLKHAKPKEAAAQYRAALATNSQYDLTEPKRLTPARVAEIEARLRDIGG